MESSLKNAEYTAEMGLDRVVIAPPYYLPISQEEMREYLEIIVPKLSLPFLMYDMPRCTKIHMSVAIIRKAKELGAIGVKDSSGDMNYLYSLIQGIKDSPNFSVIAETELFLPKTILHGGNGAVAGGADLFPKLFVDLYNDSLEHNFEEIAVLRNKLILINDNNSKHIKGIKSALSVLDICNDYVAWPIRQYGKEERNRIENNMLELIKIIN